MVLTVKNANASKKSLIKNFKVRISISQQGGSAGDAKLTYSYKNASGENKDVTISENESADARTKALGELFDIADKVVLSDSESLSNEIVFAPGPGITKQEIIFELINKEGEVVGNGCTVTWEKEEEGQGTGQGTGQQEGEENTSGNQLEARLVQLEARLARLAQLAQEVQAAQAALEALEAEQDGEVEVQ